MRGREFHPELNPRKVPAYGIDVRDPYEVEKYAKHFFKDTFEKPLPIKDADYVLSVGAISNFAGYAETEDALKQVLKNALTSLKETGEMRIYPIQHPSPGSKLEGIDDSYKRWQELIEKIAVEENVECELKPIGIHIAGNNLDNIWLEEMLLIRKRISKQ